MFLPAHARIKPCQHLAAHKEKPMATFPATKAFDLITFGDMCVDLIVSGEDVVPQFGQVEKLVGDYTLEMGGSCCIFACQAARLGLRTAVLGRVGDDGFGQLILRRLDECGVDGRYILVDPGLKTGLGIALCKANDRAILTYMGSINAVRPEDVSDDLLASARHLHHGSYYLHTRLQPAIPRIFRRARRLGLTTSLDTNWDPEERWNGGLEKVFPFTNVFLPNEQEARYISRQESRESAAAYFQRRGIGLVAIKGGEKGAWVYAGENVFERLVAPVTGGDSVGAGDSFDAGFLAGWLRGLPLDECLRIATACGSSVASRTGGLAGQLRWEEVA
jgi:sugar/nucleoside kinase (ribokinase family)